MKELFGWGGVNSYHLPFISRTSPRMPYDPDSIKALLDDRVARYNSPEFIESDPIRLPHRYTALQDREIMGLLSATLAWGHRKSILRSGERLHELFAGEPYRFVLEHREQDLRSLESFVHRTFQATDLLYFIAFFKQYYSEHHSLEQAFSRWIRPEEEAVAKGLIGFHRLFFSLPYAPERTRKHVATPERKSACKRLNMFLRWMVRKDNAGVDFGLWNSIRPSQLICPCDLHVGRVARKLGLISRHQNDWQTALELTSRLREFDPADPVKYDFALFTMGVSNEF